jgi:helix-turn-helix protein
MNSEGRETMTRKHYKIAAESFLKARQKVNSEIENEADKNKALEAITEIELNLMHMFVVDNPRFSVTKFLAASK